MVKFSERHLVGAVNYLIDCKILVLRFSDIFPYNKHFT